MPQHLRKVQTALQGSPTVYILPKAPGVTFGKIRFLFKEEFFGENSLFFLFILVVRGKIFASRGLFRLLGKDFLAGYTPIGI